MQKQYVTLIQARGGVIVETQTPHPGGAREACVHQSGVRLLHHLAEFLGIEAIVTVDGVTLEAYPAVEATEYWNPPAIEETP